MKLTNRRTYHSNTPFIDLLFNTLLGFFFLYVIAFLMINIQAKQADIKTKAEYIITVTWDDDSDDDIDTWLESPLGDKLFFRRKEIPMAHLDKDDRGFITDRVTLGDGSVISVTINQEITTIRGFIPGEWVLNIHMFRREGKELDTSPTNVQVRMEKLNPKVETVLYREYVMTEYWEEKTVARFIMTAGGDIIGWSELYKKVIKDNGQGGIATSPTDDDYNTTHSYDFDDEYEPTGNGNPAERHLYNMP